MAQEPAKTPLGAAEGTPERLASIETSEKPLGSEADVEASTPEERKPSLAERLRAEQRRSSVAKPRPDDGKPADLGDQAAGRPINRTRRAAGPAQRRIASTAANDDVPSIGGLIFALQQRPSKSPFLLAFFASLAWFLIGGFFAYGLLSSSTSSTPGGVSDLLSNPTALMAAGTILIPIAIFWFLALLVWRAQELRLMASAMTEVAIRLAEPDKLAEQSVASLGQTIRRQVAAMNDAISRAIGRAGELEALVHNEVAALERSYSDNELRVRGLISELASERQALANNSERVSEALRGVGQQVSKDLTEASANLDQRLAERGLQLTELLVSRSTQAAEQVERAQNRVQEHMPALLDRLSNEQERLGQVIEGAAKNLSALETAVSERTSSLDLTLKERTEALTGSLAARIESLETSVGQGVLIIDKVLRDRSEILTNSISEQSASLDKSLKSRTEAFASSVAQGALGLDGLLKERTRLLAVSIGEQAATLDKTLTERTASFVHTVGQSAVGLDGVLRERTKLLAASIGEETASLDKALLERTEAFVQTVGAGAVGLDGVLSARTKLLAASIGEQTEALDKTLKDRTETFVQTVGAGAVGLDGVLSERTKLLAASIGEQTEALDKTLKDRTETFAQFIGQGAVGLDKLLKERTEFLAVSIGNSAEGLDDTLKQRAQSLVAAIGEGTETIERALAGHGETFTNAVHEHADRLGQSLKERTDAFTSAANQGAIALDRTLADRAETFTNSIVQKSRAVEAAITQQASAMDRTLTERTEAVTTSLTERLKSIDVAFSQRTTEVDRVLAEHKQVVEATFGRQAAHLNDMLANNSALIRETSQQVGAQSVEAVGVLTSQTQTLREVSRGLLDQIHSLTQRFENQGQAILTAAKALDSSNTKIDSILENRHQAIIGLLQTVNTKGQDLDSMMRSYAGMVESTLTQAEGRAKQVGAALARDTAGQAQQALSQIERLREEAQAHTARAVGDLKSSFETVITQIGRQLEQMRGTFDNTSRGMRDAAQKTATDLDTLRQEMQRRMESLPQQTAQATAAIRKALTDQMKEIEAITPPAPRPQPPAPEPYRQPQLPPRPLTYRGEEPRVTDHDAPPMPAFGGRGRLHEPPQPLGGDAGGMTDALAQQLSAASHGDRRGPSVDARGHYQPLGPEPSPYGGQPHRTEPEFGPRGGGFAPQAAPSAQTLRLDEIARALDHRTAAEVWQRFRAGERGVLGRHLYSHDGQVTFDEINRRYDRDQDFRGTVDRYIGDFERLLREAEMSDPEGRMLQNYMTSETGRVYLLLAHASGRIR